jgi:hypothetical protein
MSEAQVRLNARERSLLSRLLTSELKDVRLELRDADPDSEVDFRNDIRDEEAVVLGLLTKVQAAASAQNPPAR